MRTTDVRHAAPPDRHPEAVYHPSCRRDRELNRLILGLSVMVLGVAFAATGEAAPPEKVPPTIPSPKKPAPTIPSRPQPAPAKHVVHDGHALLPLDKMSQLHRGDHHVHTAHGHKVHFSLHGGKVRGVYLKDVKGKIHHATSRRVTTECRRSPRRGCSTQRLRAPSGW
jgi:hypothetical protein